MSPNDADGKANSVDPDRGAVWSGSALFAQAYLSENLGALLIKDTFRSVFKFQKSVLREKKKKNGLILDNHKKMFQCTSEHFTGQQKINSL